MEDNIEIGWISLSELQLTNQAELYLKELEKIVHPFDVREGKKLKPSLLTGFFVV